MYTFKYDDKNTMRSVTGAFFDDIEAIAAFIAAMPSDCKNGSVEKDGVVIVRY